MKESVMLDTQAVIQAYVTSLQARQFSPQTQRAYHSDLRHFALFAGDDLTAVTVANIVAFLASGNAASATQRRRAATLRAFYHWLIGQNLVERNPMERIALESTPQLQPRPLSQDAVTRILAAIPASHTRDRALFTLLYETGMRVSEALGIQVVDLDLTPDDEKARVVGKGQREQTVLLTSAPQSVRLLRHHLAQSDIQSGPVFRGDQRYGGSTLPLEYSVAHYAWQKYCRLAGVQGTMHQVRYSRAILLRKAALPPG
jgi:integrase/recombinase XerD